MYQPFVKNRLGGPSLSFPAKIATQDHKTKRKLMSSDMALRAPPPRRRNFLLRAGLSGPIAD
jgi:hypothetical protein